MDIILYGVGEIGQRLAKRILKSEGLKIVGAIDIDPQKVGKDLGEVLDVTPLGVAIEDDAEKVLRQNPQAFVFHGTTSSLKAVYPQIVQILETGHSGVSTTEELSYPWYRYPDLSRSLDDLAKQKDRTFVGTGVNPGYLMDYFPAIVSALSANIRSISVKRYVNASLRRKPLQAKIGSTLTPEEFEKKWEERKLGHVGLVESALILAKLLGWEIKDVKETCTPVVADRRIETEYFAVEPGKVRGMVHQVEAIDSKNRRIFLDLRMVLDHESPIDEVEIDGEPPITVRFPEGVHGDFATVNVSLAVLKRVPDLPSGLLTMADLPLPIPV